MNKPALHMHSPTNSNRLHPFAVRNRGTAATELAIALPVLLLLVVGACDFGRVAHHSQVVANAARSGAEVGAMRNFTDYSQADWEAGIREAAQRELMHLSNFDVEQAEIEIEAIRASEGPFEVRVRASHPFRTTVSWPAIPNELMLSHSVTFRQFR